MPSTLARSTRTTAAVCGASGVLLVATAAAFRWSGQPTVVGVAIGLGVLVLAAMWAATKEKPRFLPAVTMLAGMALVLAPLFLDYNDGDANSDRFVGVAYAVHILVGLVLAATGFTAGKRLGVPRADEL